MSGEELAGARQSFPTQAAMRSKSADHVISPVRCSGLNAGSYIAHRRNIPERAIISS